MATEFGEFAKKLHMARDALKLSQAQVAKDIGVRDSSISQWESSKSRMPSKVHLEKIAKVYQIPLDELLQLWEKEKDAGLVTNPLAEVFQEARMRLGLLQADVAKQMNVRRESVSQWERPQGSPPGQDRIEALAALYHLDMKELQQGRQKNRTFRVTQDILNFQHGTRPMVEGRPLPCFKSLPSDFTQLRNRIIDAIRPESGILWRMVSTSCSERSFFLQMNGVSMEPKIPDQAWVAFDPDRPRPTDGDIILAYLQHNYLIGQLTTDQGRLFLRTVNPMFTDIVTPIQNAIDIIAVGIEIQVPLLSVK